MSKAQDIQIMGYFSAKQAALMSDEIDGVFQHSNNSSGDDKSAGTLCSLHLHFIFFCTKNDLMKLFPIRKKGDNLILHKKLHGVVASCAFHLASGATIQAKVIKSGTLKEYLLAAATLFSRFDME